MKEEDLIADLGRLFEVGFNVGILTFLSHHKKQIHNSFKGTYLHDLKQLRWTAICANILDTAEVDCSLEYRIAEEWLTLFLQKGFFSGYNFLHEFLSSLGWLQDANKNPIKVHYFQCVLWGDNSAHTVKKEPSTMVRDWLSQLGLNTFVEELLAQPHLLRQFLDSYEAKGEFLKADTLLLLQKDEQWRLISVDLSIFSIRILDDLIDVQTVPHLREIIARELAYLQTKSAFSDLNLDVGTVDLHFVKGLDRCFTAFKRKDKETVKLIQAASYAESFSRFLRDRQIIPVQGELFFHVFGYTDRKISAMTLVEGQRDWLETCADIYRHREETPKSLQQSRQEVLKIIQQNAAKCFVNGSEFMGKLTEVAVQGRSAWVEHDELIEGFLSSVDILPEKDLSETLVEQLGGRGLSLRDAHSVLIRKALSMEEKAPFIFLTGNPGIGKTTTVVKFLLQHIEEGFLFLYVSPRIQVNQDVVAKLYDENGVLDPRLFALTTNADLIKNYGSDVVRYLSSKRQDIFTEKEIDFIPWRYEIPHRAKSSSRIKRMTEDELEVLPATQGGVLNCLCNAISAVLSRPHANAIVATVATQALKKTQHTSTLDHLSHIFEHLYNTITGEINEDAMRKLAHRVKHLIFMVDEVTGAESGAEFLHGLQDFLEERGLIGSDYGFNTKVIVADASIVEQDVIKRHLETSEIEPDKIFFQELSTTSLAPPISFERLSFNQWDAIAINTNSYPARQLAIRYRIFLDIQLYNQEAAKTRREQIEDQCNKAIVGDILDRLNLQDGQVIVYVQNKKRLNKLIEGCEKGRAQGFKKGVDYLPIHANISENDKDLIQKKKDDVLVIFMTASASRGLSFPKTRYILVDVPHFAIEQNLMEIIQVIYRGRGDYKEDEILKTLDDQAKELVFYFSEQVSYFSEDENRFLSIQERLLHLLNLLVILKTSIMTRITGAGNIGWKKCRMIPIGGKSVSAVGNSLSERIQQLIKSLQNEAHIHYDRPQLKEMASFWYMLFEGANYGLVSSDKQKTKDGDQISKTYLSLRNKFAKQFLTAARNGFEHLLTLSPMELGYIEGSLLVIPFAGKELQEEYLMRITKIIRQEDKKIMGKMLSISESFDYPPNVRSVMRDAIKIWNELKQGNPEKTQSLSQANKGPDYHYALPLFTFLYYEQLKAYFSVQSQEYADPTFRDILAMTVQSLFPVDSVLPIGSAYDEFPFVIFRSLNLDDVRKKLFHKRYLFTSHELSILNIILAEDRDEEILFEVDE